MTRMKRLVVSSSSRRKQELWLFLLLLAVVGRFASSSISEPEEISSKISLTTESADGSSLHSSKAAALTEDNPLQAAATILEEETTESETTAAAAAGSSSTTKSQSTLSTMTISSLSESFRKNLQEQQELSRQYWQKTLAEIRNLSNFHTSHDHHQKQKNVMNSGTASFLNQWKLLLDDPLSTMASSYLNASSTTMKASVTNDTETALPLSSSASVGNETSAAATSTEKWRQRYAWQTRTLRRFEGFPSWERMLQEWSDEIQEYMEATGLSFASDSNTTSSDYSLSNFGRPMKTETLDTAQKNQATATDEAAADAEPTTRNKTDALAGMPVDKSATSSTTTSTSTTTTTLPVIPAPAKPGEAVLPHTNIADKSKRIEIITTAALPWKTGTAVNPLLRAAYLLKGRPEAGGSVTLMLPWLERPADQERVYGPKNMFASPEDQEAYIRNWLRHDANMPEAADLLNIRWYTAWQNKVENSIYSMGDITALIPAEDVDICILEEPEHLNWYRAPGESWTKKFKHVVGVLHTNYFSYALDQPAAIIRAPAMRLLCSWMCRAHCHRIIKLSGTLDQVAPEKELVENVHGVRGTFLDIGHEVRDRLEAPDNAKDDAVFAPDAEPSIYFIGKMLWSKGLGSLMELLKYAEESAGLKVKVDMYGGGPDKDAADAKAVKLGLDLPFHGPLDHAELGFTHKIFVNPSTSEVLCTTSAEALAMGKFVILPSHPSNDFFSQFPNCLTYATKEEFVGNLYYAMTHSPEPLSEEYSHALSWEAATERLEAAGCIPVEEAERMKERVFSKDAEIQIPLPPLVENEESRRLLATTFRLSRERYRKFRSRLSMEIQQNKVLPKALTERLASELDKRLDLDIDEMLLSPKLRLKLSPAELDKSLLELYDRISESPTGDVLRVIGGAGSIGLQNLYMRRQAQKKLGKGLLPDFVPFDLDESEADEDDRTAAQWVRWALRRNLPVTVNSKEKIGVDEDSKKEYDSAVLVSQPSRGESDGAQRNTLRMSCSTTSCSSSSQRWRPTSWTGLKAPVAHRARGTFARPSTRSFSLLI